MFRKNLTAARLALFAEIEESGTEFVIPEDLSTLSDEELATLAGHAQDAFDALYGDGSGTNLSEEDIQVLADLTEGIETIATEQASREAAAEERAERAAALAAKVRGTKPEDSEESEDGEGEQSAEGETPDEESTEEAPAAEATEEDAEEREPALVAGASKRREIRVNMANRARHLPRSVTEARTVKDLLRVSGDGHQFVSGMGVDWDQAGQMLERRLQSVSMNTYANAARRGQHISSKSPLLAVQKPFAEDMLITSQDRSHIEQVLAHAADETRLQGNSLVAAGGWSAPSTVMYDLLELETRDGVFTLPEVGVIRGGFHYTLGPDFADLFSEITGFHYTEAQDEAGTYGVDANGVGDDSTGDKPCYHIGDTDFDEVRLDVEGLCITAGLLQRRGYPELIARVIRGALVAHDHRVAGRVLSDIVTGSDAVNMGSGAGATAPLLNAIERQVESIRYRTRMSRSATMEGVFPFWVRAVVRTDLANRTGVELLDVTDAQIDAWFRSRGIQPQFVYNWQDLNTTTSGAGLTWPSTVQFLLYPAGTWVRGSSDIITIDNLFDSVNLGQNNYTALFTEEGVATVKRGHESRVVTVGLDPTGSTEAIRQILDTTPAAE